MLLPLGIMACFVTCYLPGAALCSRFEIKEMRWQIILGLSLLVNYLIVFYTGLIGVSPLPFIIFLGVLSGFYIWSKQRLFSWSESCFRVLWTDLLWIALCLGLGVKFLLGWWNTPIVFSMWDAIVSWNRWAIELSQFGLPTEVWNYPQLLPSFWSTIYRIQGEPIELLPKLLTPIFSLGIFSLFFSQSIKRRQDWFSLALGMYLIERTFRAYIYAGYADIPVSYFVMLSVLSLNYAITNKNDFRYIALAIVLAGAACVTKQAGFFWFLFLPLFLFVRSRVPIVWKKIIAWYLLVFVFIVLPFYLWAQWLRVQGVNESEVLYLMETIHQDKDYWERLVAGFSTLLSKWGNELSCLVPLGLLTSLFLKKTRVLAFWGITYIVLWACFFSYDERNVAIALPVIGLCAAFGLSSLMDRLQVPSFVFRISFPVLHFGFVLAFLMIAGLMSSNQAIRELHKVSKERVYNSSLNEKIYEFIKPEYTVLTDYHVLFFLPGYESTGRVKERELERVLLANNAEVDFILIHKNKIPLPIGSKSWKLAFELSDYVGYLRSE